MQQEAILGESEDHYLLPYLHRQVTQVRVDYALTLVLQDASVTIEQAASLSVGSGLASNAMVEQLVPEQQRVAAALVLFGAHVVSSLAFKSGALSIVFDSGHHLNVPVSDRYEAWSAHGPGSLCVVSQPGGRLAVWQ